MSFLNQTLDLQLLPAAAAPGKPDPGNARVWAKAGSTPSLVVQFAPTGTELTIITRSSDGDVVIPGDLTVEGDLTVQGNTTLGNTGADTTTINGIATLTRGEGLTGSALVVVRNRADETSGIAVYNQFSGGYGSVLSFYGYGGTTPSDKEAVRIQAYGTSGWGTDSAVQSGLRLSVVYQNVLTEVATFTGVATTFAKAVTITAGGLTVSAGGGTFLGAPSAPSARTDSFDSRVIIQAGSNGGTNNNEASYNMYRSNTRYGTIGVFAASTATIAGRANAATDVLISTNGGYAVAIDTSGNAYVAGDVYAGGEVRSIVGGNGQGFIGEAGGSTLFSMTRQSNGLRFFSFDQFEWVGENGSTIHMSLDGGNLSLLTGSLIVSTSQTPASAGATGTAGTIAWDASYIYVCTATDTWKRAAIATW